MASSVLFFYLMLGAQAVKQQTVNVSRGEGLLPFRVSVVKPWRPVKKSDDPLFLTDVMSGRYTLIASKKTHLTIMRVTMPLDYVPDKLKGDVEQRINGRSWKILVRDLPTGYCFVAARTYDKGWAFLVEGLCSGTKTGLEAKAALKTVKSLSPISAKTNRQQND